MSFCIFLQNMLYFLDRFPSNQGKQRAADPGASSRLQAPYTVIQTREPESHTLVLPANHELHTKTKIYIYVLQKLDLSNFS